MNLKITANLHQAIGGANFSLELFGDYLVKREGYKEHRGLEALRSYLMRKNNWLPQEVKALSMKDLRFAFAEEKNGWSMAKDARDIYPMPDMKTAE